MERKKELWLTLYGVFLALLIQVIYDWAGFLGTILRLTVGLAIACGGLIPLAIYTTNSFHWKKQSDKSKNTKKELITRLLEKRTISNIESEINDNKGYKYLVRHQTKSGATVHIYYTNNIHSRELDQRYGNIKCDSCQNIGFIFFNNNEFYNYKKKIVKY